MTTTFNLRSNLDHKQPEMCTPVPFATVSGSFVLTTKDIDSPAAPVPDNIIVYVAGVNQVYMCRGSEDSWVLLPPSGIGGAFGAGACGAYHPSGPTGTASAGSATTLTTTSTINVSLAGYMVRITAGTGKGQELLITSNTIGANSVLTFATASTTPDNTSVYLLLTGRFYVVFPGSTPGFRYWDHALQSWSTDLVVTGLTHAGTDAQLLATPGSWSQMAEHTATSGASTSLVDTNRTWTTSQWVNFQVRLTAGAGAGQVRSITANDATSLSVSAWTTNPDNTSVYAIEGNDNYLYFMGNNSTALFRYSISGNSWSTLTARGAATAVGATGDWVYGVTADDWTNDSVIKNGRRIYSFRGGATSALDYYDIPSNTWTNGVSYPRAAETFTVGTSSCYDHGNNLYIQKDNTGRWFRFNFTTYELDGWFTNLYEQGASIPGEKAWILDYLDGGTEIRWVCSILNTSQLVFRTLII